MEPLWSLCGFHLIHEIRPRAINYREHRTIIAQIADYYGDYGELTGLDGRMLAMGIR